jgi:hypothetical protein
VNSPALWWSMPHFSHCWMPSPLQAFWGRLHHTGLLWLTFLFTVGLGECPTPPPLELSSQQPLLQAFPAPRLLGRVRHSCFLCLVCLFTVHMRECPSPSLQNSGCSTLLLHVFFFQLLVYYSVFFIFSCFHGQGSVCPGVYAYLSQGVPCATYLLIWWSPKQGRSWCLVAQ